MTNRTLYTNSPRRKGDFELNFFMLNADRTTSAQLACPFFTTSEPLEILRKGGCLKMQLLIRLCSVTSPGGLGGRPKDERRDRSLLHLASVPREVLHPRPYGHARFSEPDRLRNLQGTALGLRALQGADRAKGGGGSSVPVSSLVCPRFPIEDYCRGIE